MPSKRIITTKKLHHPKLGHQNTVNCALSKNSYRENNSYYLDAQKPTLRRNSSHAQNFLLVLSASPRNFGSGSTQVAVMKVITHPFASAGSVCVFALLLLFVGASRCFSSVEVSSVMHTRPVRINVCRSGILPPRLVIPSAYMPEWSTHRTWPF